MDNGFGKLLTQKIRFVFDTHPVKKYSITAPDEVRQSFYVLKEICHKEVNDLDLNRWKPQT